MRDILNSAINQAQGRGAAASVAAGLGLVAAFWSASGYVAAFIVASNKIYDVPEGRPAWKIVPRAGDVLGLGSTVVTVWNIAKWPVLLVLATDVEAWAAASAVATRRLLPRGVHSGTDSDPATATKLTFIYWLTQVMHESPRSPHYWLPEEMEEP